MLPLRFRTEKTFVAAASLSHRKNICCCRFAFAQSFLGASDEPLHSLRSLQGLICDANPRGVAQSPLQSTYLHSVPLKILPLFLETS
ncbi:hypothetical protein C7Y47_16005 [Lysinibacillus sphaericus]|uniref:Uncharacterized protein n=1 Tax=Lysinibacillus sphaericus TaxID=1421 RepID=A0A544UD94_LYSSH|nr:hypothetical protein C7Y47_16005 [Lysinibacillus sp. SDF0037]